MMQKSPMPESKSEPTRPFLSQRFLPLAVLLLLAVLLSLFFPDFFRQVILAPILPRVALLYGIYRGFPQNVTWGFFVFVAFIMMLYATRPKISQKEKPFEESFPPSRLQQLSEIVDNATKKQHARWQMAREIQRLTFKFLEQETTDSPKTLRQRINSGELPVPQELITLMEVCDAIPNYRAFLETRDAQRNRRIPQLAALDLDATVEALVRWRQNNGGRL